MKKINLSEFQLHPFHLVEPSPWPILVSFSLLSLTTGAVMYIHGHSNGNLLLILGFVLTVSGMVLWFRDIVTEGTYEGHHTKQVQTGLITGVVLFIISEILAFFSVFWAFFYSSLAPAIEIGGIWPPLGINAMDPFSIPLLNTFLLLSSGVCQKCDLSYLFLLSNNILPFSSPKVSSMKRIGPHNYNLLCILIGSLLGDGSMERDGNGSRFAFYQAKVNGEYLLWLHKIISQLGYCKEDLPIIQSRKIDLTKVNKKNYDNFTLFYFYRFRTYTYSSFNWIYNEFYPNKRKIIPNIIDSYLSPLSLAIWIMDDGCLFKNKGLKFCTNSFTLKEIQYLAYLLKNKYNLETSIHKTGLINQYNLYIPKSSLYNLIKIVKPYIHPTMYYKINLE
jgi:hypothetical protein